MFISDVNDVNIYQRFLKTNDGQYVLESEGFTFTISSDGVKVSDKSDISLWPVYLIINELSIQSRFCLENVIIAGKLNTVDLEIF